MHKLISILSFLFIMTTSALCDPVPTTLNDFFLPGSQPNQSGNLEHPSKCDNCHGGYDTVVEPAFNWRGSMMAQAARDPLYFATVTIANQDAPESGDLCIRCHSPDGWLNGRSTPTDGSALNSGDREGVKCDFCHKLIKPTSLGVNPYPDDPDYTAGTYPADQEYLVTLTHIPGHPANGMYIADSDNAKRGPFIDAAATHKMFYSPYHAEAGICGTCHDVSNPAFSRNPDDTYSPNDLDQPAPSFSPYDLFPVERTYSEWLMSAYNTSEGVYAPQFGGNKDTVHTCQDCHMRDISGVACNKGSGVYRDDLPHHDMTGGNTFVPLLIESVYPGETDPEALAEGINRATYMLKNAATLDVSAEASESQYELEVRVTNETGHKLLSGYPEGRRMWLNIKAYNQTGSLIYESGAYNFDTGVLTHDADAKVYEIKPGITEDVSAITGFPVGPSFHFVLNSKVYFDNRIPPRGFTNANYEAIQSPPVGYTYEDGQYWDDTEYYIPGATSEVIVTLYYQTTSKEYVEFLRDENVTDDWGHVMYTLWDTHGKSTPVVMRSDTLLLTPMAGNNPPVLDPIDPQVTDEGTNLNFIVTASDPDGTTPILTVGNLPEGATFSDHNDGSATFDWTPSFDQAGVYPMTFYATDDSAAADSGEIDITINNVNRPPVLDAVVDSSVAEGDTIIILISAYDPDGTIPSLSIPNLPPNAAFTDHNDGTGTFIFAPNYEQEGVYSLTVNASDGDLVDSHSFSITVTNTNRPPVLDPIGPQTFSTNIVNELIVSAHDDDGIIPTLTAEPLPEEASFVDNNNGTGTFSWTPTVDQIGQHQVLFTASDLELSDDELVVIEVIESAVYVCGDANGDGVADVGDAVYLINYIFQEGPAPDPLCEGDANHDGQTNVGDGVYIIAYVFSGGPAPIEGCCQ
jgi:mono/diheme cytochrome c family protein